MKHTGYLTPRDKILIVVAVVIVVPLAIVGWPFLVAGLVALCVVLIVVMTVSALIEPFTKRRPPAAGAALDLGRLQPRRTPIRHFRTPSGSDRGRPD